LTRPPSPSDRHHSRACCRASLARSDRNMRATACGRSTCRPGGCVAQAASPLRTGLRCRLAIRSSIAADELRSMDSAHRTHLAAKWFHVALLSAERVNSAIARHSAANLLNFSVEFIEPSSLCRILSYPTCAFISAGDHCTHWNGSPGGVVPMAIRVGAMC